MEKNRESGGEMEKAFQLLPPAEREAVISHGVALRLSDLKKRLFLAESKVRQLEEKYGATLNRIEKEGLPDNADVHMHEDYIMWRHWFGVAEKTRSDILLLEKIAERGVHLGELQIDAGH